MHQYSYEPILITLTNGDQRVQISAPQTKVNQILGGVNVGGHARQALVQNPRSLLYLTQVVDNGRLGDGLGAPLLLVNQVRVQRVGSGELQRLSIHFRVQFALEQLLGCCGLEVDLISNLTQISEFFFVPKLSNFF